MLLRAEAVAAAAAARSSCLLQLPLLAAAWRGVGRAALVLSSAAPLTVQQCEAMRVRRARSPCYV